MPENASLPWLRDAQALMVAEEIEVHELKRDRTSLRLRAMLD